MMGLSHTPGNPEWSVPPQSESDPSTHGAARSRLLIYPPPRSGWTRDRASPAASPTLPRTLTASPRPPPQPCQTQEETHVPGDRSHHRGCPASALGARHAAGRVEGAGGPGASRVHPPTHLHGDGHPADGPVGPDARHRRTASRVDGTGGMDRTTPLPRRAPDPVRASSGQHQTHRTPHRARFRDRPGPVGSHASGRSPTPAPPGAAAGAGNTPPPVQKCRPPGPRDPGIRVQGFRGLEPGRLDVYP